MKLNRFMRQLGPLPGKGGWPVFLGLGLASSVRLRVPVRPLLPCPSFACSSNSGPAREGERGADSERLGLSAVVESVGRGICSLWRDCAFGSNK